MTTTPEERARELRKRLDEFIDREGEWDTTALADAAICEVLTQVQAEVRKAALEEAAQVIEQCNREGPYNAIQGASRIREIIELEKPRKWIQSDAQAAAPAKETKNE